SRFSGLLPPGRHRVRVEAPGWRPHESEVDVPAGTRVSHQPEMVPEDVRLVLKLRGPKSVTLKVDGAVVARAAADGSAHAVRPGAHTVTATAEGYRPFEA